MTSAEKRNATVVGISRTLNSNAKNGSVKKKLIDKVETKTARSPGPVPPNHVASSTAGKKREVRTPKLCSGNVTAVQIATNKTERPYRQTAGESRRKLRSDFDILLAPKVYLRRSSSRTLIRLLIQALSRLILIGRLFPPSLSSSGGFRPLF